MRINYRNLFLSITAISTFSISLLGQTAIPQSTDPKREERRFKNEELRNLPQAERRYNERIGKLPLERSRLRPLPGTKISYNKQYENTAEQLVTPVSYREKYKSFLKDDKHELARIPSDPHCFEGLIVQAEEVERCKDAVPVQGNGSYYSFFSGFNYYTASYYGTPAGMFKSDADQPYLDYISSEKENFLNNWWDLHYDKNRFEAGRGGVQGVIADLGKRDLSEITLKSPELKFLVDYQPGLTFEDSEKAVDTLAKGITVKNVFYTNSLPAEVGNTYILRSIHYPFPYKLRLTSSMDRKSYKVRGNETTVAFQIVGKEPDGSLIVLWKELDKKKL